MSIESKEVIVVFGNEVLRVPIKAWQNIMDNTGQMRDAWFDDADERGTPKRVAQQAYNAYVQLNGLGR